MKNWVYYMREGIKNMWLKKPKKKKRTTGDKWKLYIALMVAILFTLYMYPW